MTAVLGFSDEYLGPGPVILPRLFGESASLFDDNLIWAEFDASAQYGEWVEGELSASAGGER